MYHSHLYSYIFISQGAESTSRSWSSVTHLNHAQRRELLDHHFHPQYRDKEGSSSDLPKPGMQSRTSLVFKTWAGWRLYFWNLTALVWPIQDSATKQNGSVGQETGRSLNKTPSVNWPQKWLFNLHSCWDQSDMTEQSGGKRDRGAQGLFGGSAVLLGRKCILN